MRTLTTPRSDVALSSRRPSPTAAGGRLACVARLARTGFAAMACLIAAISCAIAPAAAQSQPGECPEILPVADLIVGTVATAWTVERGDTPEPFQVEILGVFTDGIAPGRDMIIVEIGDVAGSDMIERSGGIWGGMSGSPVYVDDKLVGAVAWSFGAGPSRIGGVTAAEDMLEIAAFENPPAVTAAGHARELPRSMRSMLAHRTGLAPVHFSSFNRIAVPFGVSGLDPSGHSFVQGGLDRAGISAVVTPASRIDRPRSAVVAPRPVPGGNFAGVVSFGDFSSGGVGTTTYVCEDTALAFGHPLSLLGSTSLSANSATALTIIPDPTLRPFKLAAFGPSFGLLDQDRGVAIRAKLGSNLDLIPVRSLVRAFTPSRSRRGTSWTPSSRFVPDITALHLLSNLESVFDERGDGTARVRWRVVGRRTNGQKWMLRRSNRYASPANITFTSVGELLNQLAILQVTPLEEVSFESVKLRARVRTEYRAYELDSFTVTVGGQTFDGQDHFDLVAGEEIRLDVALRGTDGTQVARELSLVVPATAAGSATLRVLGGASTLVTSDDNDPCLFDRSTCDDGTGDSFLGLVRALESEPRNDDLMAVLTVTGDGSTAPPAIASLRLPRLVSGSIVTFPRISTATTTTATVQISTTSSTITSTTNDGIFLN